MVVDRELAVKVGLKHMGYNAMQQQHINAIGKIVILKADYGSLPDVLVAIWNNLHHNNQQHSDFSFNDFLMAMHFIKCYPLQKDIIGCFGLSKHMFCNQVWLVPRAIQAMMPDKVSNIWLCTWICLNYLLTPYLFYFYRSLFPTGGATIGPSDQLLYAVSTACTVRSTSQSWTIVELIRIGTATSSTRQHSIMKWPLTCIAAGSFGPTGRTLLEFATTLRFLNCSWCNAYQQGQEQWPIKAIGAILTRSVRQITSTQSKQKWWRSVRPLVTRHATVVSRHSAFWTRVFAIIWTITKLHLRQFASLCSIKWKWANHCLAFSN